MWEREGWSGKRAEHGRAAWERVGEAGPWAGCWLWSLCNLGAKIVEVGASPPGFLARNVGLPVSPLTCQLLARQGGWGWSLLRGGRSLSQWEALPRGCSTRTPQGRPPHGPPRAASRPASSPKGRARVPQAGHRAQPPRSHPLSSFPFLSLARSTLGFGSHSPSEVAPAQGLFFFPLCFPKTEPRCCLPLRSRKFMNGHKGCPRPSWGQGWGEARAWGRLGPGLSSPLRDGQTDPFCLPDKPP